jgi:hypothetical protein
MESPIQPRSLKPVNRPTQDEDESALQVRPIDSAMGGEPRGVQSHIADADKKARSGTEEEPVRSTPPAGAWNDTSRD